MKNLSPKSFFVCSACGAVRPDYEVSMGSSRYVVLCSQCASSRRDVASNKPTPVGGVGAVPSKEVDHA